MSVQVAISNAITQGIDHGHAALLINGKAYTYGRYGIVHSAIESDGVLRIYHDANAYLYQTRKQGDDISVYTLNLTDSEAEKIIRYYESNRVPYSDDDSQSMNYQAFTYSDPRGSYEILFGDNCATVVVAAINAGRPGSMNILTDNPSVPISPWGLNHVFQFDLHTNGVLVTHYYYAGRLSNTSGAINYFGSSYDVG